MKVAKRFLMLVSVLTLGFLLIACNETNGLTSFEFSGLEDVEVEFGSEFNILDNVTAKGNDEVDYTNLITFSTISNAIAEDGTLDTKIVGNNLVRYEVIKDEVKLQQWRTITVLTPERTGDELLANGNFEEGTAHWTVDQGQITASIDAEENGALKLELIAGANAHEPRLTQMGVPFENDTFYKISFEAKSTVEKVINLQVGEMLASEPWFTDFKRGQTEVRKITTEWATYEYTFKHVLENDRGGVLFEFGTVNGNTIDATLWFRNIKAEEVPPVADTTPPTISGASDRVFEVGTDFNPTSGVTAHDIMDGDVTDSLEVVITNEEGAVLEAIDNSIAGTYTITYTAVDSAGNEATLEIQVTFEEMTFIEHNLISNGDFTDGVTDWAFWFADWNGTAYTQAMVDGKVEFDITNGGEASWNIQFLHEGINLEQGKQYLLTYTVSANVARTIETELGETDPTNEENFIDYAPKLNNVEVGSEPVKITQVFEMTAQSTTNAKIVFKLGTTDNFEVGKVYIHDVRLQERYFAPLIDPDFTNEAHVAEQADGVTHMEAERTVDSLKLTVNSVGGAAYIPHYFYELSDGLLAGTYTFKLSVTGDVARTLRFNIILPDENHRSILPAEGDEGAQFIDFLLGENEVYNFEVEFVVEEAINIPVKIELDFGPIVLDETHTGTFILENISLEKK